MKRDGLLYTVVFVFVVTFLFTGALSWVHTSTSGRVADHARERYQRAVLDALGIAAGSQADVFAVYAEVERRVVQSGETVYRVDNGSESGYAMAFSGPGVWGAIDGVVGIEAGSARIVGLEILDQNETPGLGGRITEDRFLDQFRGERLGADGRITLRRGGGDTDPDNASVDAIAGATGTSRAFHRIVNDAVSRLRTLTEEPG